MQQVLQLTTQMDKMNTKTAGTSSSEPHTSPVPGTTRVAEPREPPRRRGSNLVQQVLRLATQMDKTNTKTAGTSTSEPKRRGR